MISTLEIRPWAANPENSKNSNASRHHGRTVVSHTTRGGLLRVMV